MLGQGVRGSSPLHPVLLGYYVMQEPEQNIQRQLQSRLASKPDPMEEQDVWYLVPFVTLHVSRAIQDPPPRDWSPKKRDRINHSRTSHACRWPWSWRPPAWLRGRPESPSLGAVLTFPRWERRQPPQQQLPPLTLRPSGAVGYTSKQNLCHLCGPSNPSP